MMDGELVIGEHKAAYGGGKAWEWFIKIKKSNIIITNSVLEYGLKSSCEKAAKRTAAKLNINIIKTLNNINLECWED